MHGVGHQNRAAGQIDQLAGERRWGQQGPHDQHGQQAFHGQDSFRTKGVPRSRGGAMASPEGCQNAMDIEAQNVRGVPRKALGEPALVPLIELGNTDTQ
ncbi:hypothetical protein ROR02_11590 [Pararhodospirillum oryzae]|uniref:Uncharacterized protein n=1 Tax=Pararhodospirillum oryzae TaxID=478448 RepID=A0A512H6H4_9PROT|nr:hypothetical protein ROR02_11590 [Pararhodospirillum oryzae]